MSLSNVGVRGEHSVNRNQNRTEQKLPTENRTDIFSVYNRNQNYCFGNNRKPKLKTEIQDQ